mmetsp:Transcript_15575/g.23479  ORF Transcript_15575/g.23479 Transcript_15575/m.23479 type:complete len:435 (-) Transcript_15575:86-1390(-)
MIITIALLVFGLHTVHGKGEAAVIAFSKDAYCKGQELFRAYSGQCTAFYADDDAAIDYFKFTCDSSTGSVLYAQYTDNTCRQMTGNKSTILQNYGGDGSCQKLVYAMKSQTNFQSVQLFCGGIAANKHPRSYYNAFQSEKIAFTHYSNSENECLKSPSVVELFAPDTCLYYPAIESSTSTELFARFSREVSETSSQSANIISGQFFNNAQCRRDVEHIGPPNDGGEIGHPVRKLQGGPEDGGPEAGGPEDGGPEDGGPEDGGPEDGGPEDGGPEAPDYDWSGERGPAEDERSEVLTIDSKMHICMHSTASLLGVTVLDASISAFSTVSTDNSFKFMGYDGRSVVGSGDSTGITAGTLVLWAFVGSVFGLAMYMTYVYFVPPSEPSTRASSHVRDAQKLSSSTHSLSGLLYGGSTNGKDSENDYDDEEEVDVFSI